MMLEEWGSREAAGDARSWRIFSPMAGAGRISGLVTGRSGRRFISMEHGV